MEAKNPRAIEDSEGLLRPPAIGNSKMRLTIIYTTQLKSALGIGSEAIDIPPPPTPAALLTTLAEMHGAEFRRLTLGASGQPLASLIVCVGDQQVPVAAPVQLKDGDTITILSAISGG
jgi:molybdopterin converting factor small subunit